MPGFNSSKFIFRGESIRFAAFIFLSLLVHLLLFSLQFQHHMPIAVATEPGIGIVERPASSFKPVVDLPAKLPVPLPEPAPIAALPEPAAVSQQRPIPGRVTDASQSVLQKKQLTASAKETKFAELPTKPAAATEQTIRPLARSETPLDTGQLSPFVSSETLSWRDLRTESQTQRVRLENHKTDAVSQTPEQTALPRYDLNPLPEYPEVARRRGYEGNVELDVQVLADGRVGAVELRSSSGHRSLDLAARKAVRLWQFRPAISLGIPVESRVVVPVRFVLGGD